MGITLRNQKRRFRAGTALNAGETENFVTDQLEAEQQRERKVLRDFLGTRTSSRRTCQYQEGEELRKYCNEANRCFCTAVLFKPQDWCSTGHGSHTPLQDDGDMPMMDLARSLQTLYVHTFADVQKWYVRTQTWYEYVAASICTVALICAQRPSVNTETATETETETETDSCQY